MIPAMLSADARASVDPRVWAGLVMQAASPTANAQRRRTPAARGRKRFSRPCMVATSEMASARPPSTQWHTTGIERAAARNPAGSRRPRSSRSSGRVPKVTEKVRLSAGNTRHE